MQLNMENHQIIEITVAFELIWMKSLCLLFKLFLLEVVPGASTFIY